MLEGAGKCIVFFQAHAQMRFRAIAGVLLFLICFFTVDVDAAGGREKRSDPPPAPTNLGAVRLNNCSICIDMP